MVGFHITKGAGPGVELFDTYNSAGSTITLYDGIIQAPSGANSVENGIGKNLYIRNVYVSGTDYLIHDPGQTVTGTGTWKRITEYGYTSTTDYSPLLVNDTLVDSYSLINGTIAKASIKTIQSGVSAPPPDLVTRHGVARLPSFEDVGALVLTEATAAVGDGTTDNYSLIQNLLNNNPTKTIVIPKGRFAVSSTLTLPAGVKLVGIDRNMSRIVAKSTWLPTTETAVISTVNDANATTWLGPLTIGYPIGNGLNDYFAEVKWQAGRNSTVHAITSRFGITGGVTDGATLPHARCIITGNGGGKWYFWGMDESLSSNHTGYRHLRISGTTEPLWMYGCNLEKGQGDTRSEVTDSQNVRIFNVKVETSRDVMWINNSQNIGASGGGSMLFTPNSGDGHFDIRGTSNNVVLGNINPQKCNSNLPSTLKQRLFDSVRP